MSLSEKFDEYTEWRNALTSRIEIFRERLAENGLSDAQIEERLKNLLARLRADRLMIAFVAEFSRGKSELINAIFFSDYGNRILPSSAGRTTMCPTELFFDVKKPHGVELLPIQTRATDGNVSDYRLQKDAWHFIGINIDSAESLATALQHVQETIRVSVDEARRLGFDIGGEANTSNNLFQIDEHNQVEIPRWRHALINFPHPLLRQGLVILDTPGLNAIGAEPELTLSLLPSAHATLFVLAADAGVTQSDLTVWREHICAQSKTGNAGKLVVLNKIDSLWDELKSEEEINKIIDQQAANCAQILEIPATQIFTVSAHKGLVAKVKNDAKLLTRSRLKELENTLSNSLLPDQYDLVKSNAEAELNDIFGFIQGVLASRLDNFKEQRFELEELSGKNKNAVTYMLNRIQFERKKFAEGVNYLAALRKVFADRVRHLQSGLEAEKLRQLTQTTRKVMLSAAFSKHLSGAMEVYFGRVLDVIWAAEEEIKEIHALITSAYEKFAKEYGLQIPPPAAFDLRRCEKEVGRLHLWCAKHINSTLSLLTQDKRKVTQRFFEEVTLSVRHVVEKTNRDCAVWLDSIIIPLEAQVREYEQQLERRVEAVSRIHKATNSLEERLNDVHQRCEETEQKIEEFHKMSRRIIALFRPSLET